MRIAKATADALGCELAGEVVRRFGRVRVGVTGTSMIPAVWPGDVLVVERRAAAEIGRGEIVLAQRGDSLVAHRVVGLQFVAAGLKHGATQTFSLRGDALLSADAPLRREELLGAVVAIERRGDAILPARRLSFGGSLLAALARRSSLAARVFVRIHAFICTRPERVELCQS
jgi:signal peptidase I